MQLNTIKCEGTPFAKVCNIILYSIYSISLMRKESCALITTTSYSQNRIGVPNHIQNHIHIHIPIPV